MKAFEELIHQNLHWVQPSMWRNSYQLQTDHGEILATIKQPSLWKSRVEVESTGNRWSFERVGFWRRRIVIKSIGTDAEPAEFLYKGMVGGELRFQDGRVFIWKQSNFWGTKWAWATEDDLPIIGFEIGGFMRVNSSLRLDPGIEDMPSLPLLIFLGWYIYTLYRQDSSS